MGMTTAAWSTGARFWREPPGPHKLRHLVRRLGFAVDALLIAVAGALAVRLAFPDAAWIERNYANGAYPGIDHAVRVVTGPLPFTLGDVLFVFAVSWLLRYWWVALRRVFGLRRRRWPALGRIALRTIAITAGI